MSQQQFDVAGLGNAIMDIIASVDDRFLLTHRIAKGAMMLMDEFRAKELLKALADGSQALSSLHEVAGGSAANTLAGLASLGGNGLYVGKVCDDRLGHVFAKSMSAQGITFTTHPTRAGSTTASCLIAVTPDGQRSMSTYLGACRELTPDDVDEEEVAAAQHPLYRRLSVGRGAGQGRPRARRSRRVKGAGGQGRAVAVRQFLRRPFPRRIPASAGPRRRTSCSPMKTRRNRCSRSRISTACVAGRKHGAASPR